MKTNAIRGLSSIIVPCWNQVEFTQQCIAALKEHTRPPWELIVVDNGSTDGTALYLAGVRDLAAVPVTVVTNATNLGFPAAINQGLQLARGEYLVLLNNDVVVTDGWLDQLIALANARTGQADDFIAEHAEDAETQAEKKTEDPVISFAETSPPPSVGRVISFAETTPPGPPFARGGKFVGSASRRQLMGVAATAVPRLIGLVGPMSNYAAPPQLVDGVPYRDVQDMHAVCPAVAR